MATQPEGKNVRLVVPPASSLGTNYVPSKNQTDILLSIAGRCLFDFAFLFYTRRFHV